MLQSVISRAALGRAARIGALYDVRTETFLHDSLFDTKIHEDCVDKVELGDTSVELVMSDSIQDKFHKLDIEAELQISLLAGLVKLSGSGAYLNENKKSARTQRMTLVYKIRTINEEFMLRQNRDKIDVEYFKADNLQATHVVIGIDWGAVCSITCLCENTDGKDETAIKGALGAHLEELKALVSAEGSARVDYKDIEKEKLEKFTFKCMSDVSTTDKDLPTSFEGALDLAKSLRKIVKQTNGGKGVPVLYILMPLETVTKICRLQITLELHYGGIKEEIVKRSAQVLESVIKNRQKLFDIQKDLHDFADYVAETSLSSIDKHMDEIAVDESAFKTKLQELVTMIRRQEAEVSSLDQFLSESVGASSLFARCEKYIRDFQGDLNTVHRVKAWQKRGINYLGKKDQFSADDAAVVYVLCKPVEPADEARTQQQANFFLRCQKTYSQFVRTMFTVVDETLKPELWGKRERKTIIEEYKNGHMTCKDYYEKESKSTEMCLMKHQETSPCDYKPSERANVKIRCPNSLSFIGECSSDAISWKCSKCKELVEYGLNTSSFYCKCGKSKPSKSLFRCNEGVHGIDYIPYPEDILQNELGSLRATQEKNILLLGETGVGKSTWINAFANYMWFADLEDARQADEFSVLIPSKFTFTKKGQPVEINVGEPSENEVLKTGQSATQQTRSYIFHVGDQKIRLIDTPGIGDSRGIEQDRKNFDNIFAYLSFYDEIHAVCIFLHPNNSRPNAMFRFCIQELLTQLHNSAKKNIVFCFTNARAKFYKPGDTLPVLNSMLNEKRIGITANPNNYFCYDNESFRFLACLRSKVDFSDEDIESFAESWSRAVDETTRLFDHIKKIPPHKIRNSRSVNETRRVIVAMSESMAEVARTIQEKMQRAEDVKVQIDRIYMSMISQRRIRRNEIEFIETFRLQTEENLSELQNEEKTIWHVMAKYGAFLKDNSIIPYNDAVGDYLDMVIDLEEKKADEIRNNDVLRRLKTLRAEYDKEKKILDEAMASRETTTFQDVMQLQQQLFQLKHFGGTLKNIFDGIKNSQSSRNMHFQEIIAPVRQFAPEYRGHKERGLATVEENTANTTRGRIPAKVNKLVSAISRL